MRLRVIPKTERSEGFTLAEVLAALLLMAIVIPAAVEAMHIATRAGEVAARKGEAALIAQRILNQNVVTTNWNQSSQSGTVMQGQHQFRWNLHSENWTQDPSQNVIMQLSAEVFFFAQNREYSVRMSTLVDSSQPTNGSSSTSR
jgi:prepilin-type N-terminal cleavage/methylation domain-containing protein